MGTRHERELVDGVSVGHVVGSTGSNHSPNRGDMSERLRRIMARWVTDQQITRSDVSWLLERAKTAETLEAANSLRKATSASEDPLSDIMRAFGGRS